VGYNAETDKRRNPVASREHNERRLPGISVSEPVFRRSAVHTLVQHISVYAFSTIGAMVSIKFMEAIMFTGASINDRLQLKNWHSETTKNKFSTVVNCTANNVDQFAYRNDLFQHDYPELLEELTMISGGLSLAFKVFYG
ncbi:hypothetical protein V5799_018049, partial [Amblyomma americanum]